MRRTDDPEKADEDTNTNESQITHAAEHMEGHQDPRVPARFHREIDADAFVSSVQMKRRVVVGHNQRQRNLFRNQIVKLLKIEIFVKLTKYNAIESMHERFCR